MRHREAGERTLLTAIASGLSPAALADALLAAATERAYADTGVQFISVGALTTSAQSVDMSLRVQPA